MHSTLHCIALRTVRHTDRASILTAWSAEHGRVALLIPGGVGAESRRRRALTAPMSLFECVADIRPDREVYSMRDLKALRVNAGIAASPTRTAVALFLSEVTAAILCDGQPDAATWSLLTDMVATLDSASGHELAAFPLYYLCMLGARLGITPDPSEYRRGMYFDMIDSRFVTVPPITRQYLTPDRARIAAALLTLPLKRIGRLGLSRATRSDALDTILEYYTLHYTRPGTLRSLDIVRML